MADGKNFLLYAISHLPQAPLFSGLLNQLRHQSRPSSLMARPDSCSIVPMEILIEQYIVPPMWIVLKGLRTAEYRTFPVGILEKDVRQTV